MISDIKNTNFHNTILETIGDTPLVRLNRINRGHRPQIFVKVESFNPGGSVKDRIGIRMIEEAERVGRLKPGGPLLRPHPAIRGLDSLSQQL